MHYTSSPTKPSHVFLTLMSLLNVSTHVQHGSEHSVNRYKAQVATIMYILNRYFESRDETVGELVASLERTITNDMNHTCVQTKFDRFHDKLLKYVFKWCCLHAYVLLRCINMPGKRSISLSQLLRYSRKSLHNRCAFIYKK